MSSSLHYRPSSPVNYYDIPFAVKKAISPMYWEHDGSMGGEPIVIDHNDMPYLKGVRDGGCREVQVLIDAISEFGSIELFFRV